jgi:RNA polymerase sigma-70 factor (ECF subfamily)
MSVREQTDKELAQLIANSTESDKASDAFRELRDRYDAKTFRFLMSLVRRDVAADLHQETWLRVWKKTNTFDGACFQAWVFQIARNAARDHHRKMKRRREQSLPEEGYLDPSEDSETVENMIDAEERSALKECMKKLEQRPRDIVLARLEGQDYASISQRIDVTVPNARKIFLRCKDTLASCVQQKIRA